MGLVPDSFDAALIVPILCLSLPVIYFSRQAYANYVEKQRLLKQGIGRGVPGFLTGSQKVALPLAIVARIRMGEDVSAEEITEAINAEKAREIRLAEIEAEEAAAAEAEKNWKAGELKPLKVPKTYRNTTHTKTAHHPLVEVHRPNPPHRNSRAFRVCTAYHHPIRNPLRSERPTTIPLSSLEEGVAAHRVAKYSKALLKKCPALDGRIKVIRRKSENFSTGADSINANHHTAKTTYLVSPPTGEGRKLTAELSTGEFSNDQTDMFATASFSYARDVPVKASFEFVNMSSGSGGRANLSSTGLSNFFTILANDLQLPIVHSADALPIGDSLKYDVEELQTPDVVQKDRTFGILVRLLLPSVMREMEFQESSDPNYEERTGREDDHLVGDMIRGAAVAGVDFAHDQYD
ncbi:hypothetical protein P7C70_g1384, partial [Phenoliferia sp. Uapishka_3]